MNSDLIINFINILTEIYMVLIFIRVILSWMPKKVPKIQKFIFDTTEPVLAPIRRMIPPIGGMLDLSPIIAYLLLYLIQTLVTQLWG